MGDEYAYVGPALFEMGYFPEEVHLVRDRPAYKPVEPREVWLPINTTWVRLDGQWISGWRGDKHFAFRPSLLNLWKIRRAARAWEKATARKAPTPTPHDGGQ